MAAVATVGVGVVGMAVVVVVPLVAGSCRRRAALHGFAHHRRGDLTREQGNQQKRRRHGVAQVQGGQHGATSSQRGEDIRVRGGVRVVFKVGRADRRSYRRAQSCTDQRVYIGPQ
eukprot:scaffold118242_cov75-Phaeocystis_antarctica.AAC.2